MRQTNLTVLLAVFALISAGCSTGSNIAAPQLSPVSKEVEAREVMRSILFDQRTHYIGNQRFTTSLQDLETTNSRLETPNYIYRIQPQPSRDRGVVVTAVPRHPGLRSFTGVVFAVKAGKEKLAISEICETTQPSTAAPKAPAAPRRANETIQCPVGSRSSMSFLASQ